MPKKRPVVRIECTTGNIVTTFLNSRSPRNSSGAESTGEKGREGPEASNGGEENGQG